jgi:hypothetical protein
VGSINLNQVSVMEPLTVNKNQFSFPNPHVQLQENIPLGSRQFESYLGRRQVIE